MARRPGAPASPGARVAAAPDTRNVPVVPEGVDRNRVASIAAAARVPPVNVTMPPAAEPLPSVPPTTRPPPPSVTRPVAPVAEPTTTLPATRSPPPAIDSVGVGPAEVAEPSNTLPASCPTASTTAVPELICTASNREGCQRVSHADQSA